MIPLIFNHLRKLAAAAPMPAHRTANITPNRPNFKKRHWCLGSTVILIGSWITHTTTATVYDDFNNQQASVFAPSMPGEAHAINSSQSNKLFVYDTADAPEAITFRPEERSSPAVQSAKVTTPIVEAMHDETTYTVRRGDTLGGIFKRLNFDLSLPYLISQHETGKQLVSLSVGRDFIFTTDAQGRLKQIDYPMGALQQLVVELDNGVVEDVRIHDLPYIAQQNSVSGKIDSSLYDAALEAGLSISMVMEMVRIFGWDIDFVQDIRQGDNFHVIYDEYLLEGEKLSDGNILAAEFTTQNHTYRAVRFEDSEGDVSYYTPQGESMLGTFLRSPVEFSRISSRFGKRKHPILKTWRAHKGVDYAASRGTPIRATADGKVIHAGRKGGYGNTIILRHAGRFSTLYGHMNGYAKGVRSGSRVKQGDIIGYIGSTGLATGPHLHYEFRLDGVHRNPLTFKTPKASSVSTAQRTGFEHLTNRWMAQLNSLTGTYRLAQSRAEIQNKTQAL